MSTMTVVDEPLTPSSLKDRYASLALPLTFAGAALFIVSAFLKWSYDPAPLENVSLYGNPAPTQFLALGIGVIAIAVALGRGPLRRAFSWFDTAASLRAFGFGALAYAVLVVLSIAAESGGLINAEPGAYVVLAAGLLLALGGWLMPEAAHGDPLRSSAPGWVEILVIAGLLGSGLLVAAYALGLKGGGAFVTLLAFLAGLLAMAVKGGFFQWFSVAAARHGHVLRLGAVAVAFAFPFTQNGSDANMSIATQVIIFATTALGLNIVVGLAGLLDLGYIAFLGAGAYVGAMLSGAATATIGWQPPFLVTAVIGACVSAILGLIIGSPTLRVSGDYLAIVTLAFGEIFRITVNNMDGHNVLPDLTHGPNGIAGIPELDFFGFNFGQEHTIFGITLTRFANYYFLLLLMMLLVITVFSRLNNSRIGRGWVAIREDERAAEAMGVNVFGLKLLAFAGGATLAGLAGTIKAHHDLAVSPDQYVFLESAFLLAAVVLGGMGTVAGVLLGATILKLLPEKLRFLSEYRLLMFGVLLVLMMRFRPEGMVPSARRQLEFHADDTELAEEIQELHVEKEEATS